MRARLAGGQAGGPHREGHSPRAALPPFCPQRLLPAGTQGASLSLWQGPSVSCSSVKWDNLTPPARAAKRTQSKTRPLPSPRHSGTGSLHGPWLPPMAPVCPPPWPLPIPLHGPRCLQGCSSFHTNPAPVPVPSPAGAAESWGSIPSAYGVHAPPPHSSPKKDAQGDTRHVDRDTKAQRDHLPLGGLHLETLGLLPVLTSAPHPPPGSGAHLPYSLRPPPHPAAPTF